MNEKRNKEREEKIDEWKIKNIKKIT